MNITRKEVIALAKEAGLTHYEDSMYDKFHTLCNLAIAKSRLAEGEQAGWVRVPVEPTQAMLLAYDPSHSTSGFRWCKHQWATMLAAAPQGACVGERR